MNPTSPGHGPALSALVGLPRRARAALLFAAIVCFVDSSACSLAEGLAQGRLDEVRVVEATHPLGVPVHPGERAHAVSGRIPDGARVRVVRWSADRAWAEVEGGGARGWITARYFATSERAPGGAEEAPGRADEATSRAAPTPERARGPSAPDPLAADSAWASREACEVALTRRPALPTGAARVASWNIRWFPDGRANGQVRPSGGTDVAWLSCAIAFLGIDVVAVQEIVRHARGREQMAALLAALQAHTGARWATAFDACPEDGRQHVGFLYRQDRVEMRSVEPLPGVNPGPSGCHHRLRPGLLALARFSNGLELHLVNVHLDSGQVQRDYDNRERSAATLATVAARLRREDSPGLVVLGDFNTMGCSQCSPARAADDELLGLERTLSTPGAPLSRLSTEVGCTEYGGSRTSALDHFFANREVTGLPGARLVVGGPCGETQCTRSAAVGRLPFFESLSDHCPLVLALEPGPRSRRTGSRAR